MMIMTVLVRVRASHLYIVRDASRWVNDVHRIKNLLHVDVARSKKRPARKMKKHACTFPNAHYKTSNRSD